MKTINEKMIGDIRLIVGVLCNEGKISAYNANTINGCLDRIESDPLVSLLGDLKEKHIEIDHRGSKYLATITINKL